MATQSRNRADQRFDSEPMPVVSDKGRDVLAIVGPHRLAVRRKKRIDREDLAVQPVRIRPGKDVGNIVGTGLLPKRDGLAADDRVDEGTVCGKPHDVRRLDRPRRFGEPAQHIRFRAPNTAYAVLGTPGRNAIVGILAGCCDDDLIDAGN